MSKLADLLRACAAHPALPPGLALLAVLLCAPALGNGLFLDDYIHGVMLTPPEELPAELAGMSVSVDQLFAFIGEDRDALGGFLPWWTSDELRIAFWRPVTGISHWLDHRLWPERPWLMHLHSLLWLGLAVWVATVFFRRILGPEAMGTAALAAFFFAVDELHAWSAMWVANRNALLTVTFGLLCLVAHDRWRRDGWAPGAWLSPLCLVLAVGSGEAAVACGGWLLGHALFLDAGPMRERLRALLPTASVGLAWLWVYRLRGFGAHGSGGYLDPLGEPLRFLAGAIERTPILVLGLGTPLSADLYLMASEDGQALLWWLGILVSVVLGALLLPLLRTDPRARFLAFGLATSLVPACIIFPMNRQLLYASLGAVGLLALLIVHAFGKQRGDDDGEEGRPGQARRWVIGRWMLGTVAGLLLVVHGLVAPVALFAMPSAFDLLGRVMERAVFSLPSDPAIRDQRTVVVQVPGHVFTSGSRVMRAMEGRPNPREMLVLGAGIGELVVERVDARTLVVRPEGGYLPALGQAPGRAGSSLDLMRTFSAFDTLFYDPAKPPPLGARFDAALSDEVGVEIEITRLTDDGRPAEATFRFDAELEDPSNRWLTWKDGVFVPFEPPAVGDGSILPRPELFP